MIIELIILKSKIKNIKKGCDLMNKLRHTLPAYIKALFNKNTPISSKVLALLAIVYIIVPADVLPDVVPFLGWLDDGLITMVLVYFSNKLIPDEIIKKEEKKQIEN